MLTARPRKRVMQFPRTSRLNERYYARDNQPSFYQFGQDYHFYDDEGRLYRVAVQNNRVFQNERLRMGADGPARGLRRCQVEQYGAVVLYVKLARRETAWFGDRAIGRTLLLYERRSHEAFVVRLRTAFKHNTKRRTGTVTVSGLGSALCDTLLNE